MRQRATYSRKKDEGDRNRLTTKTLSLLVEQWYDDGVGANHSERGIQTRRECMEKLLWFLKDRELDGCGTAELRAFLAHMRSGHEQPGGRWGNPACTKEVRPAYIHKFYRNLRAFFNWCVDQEEIDRSPVDLMTAPVLKSEQIQPFSESEAASLLAAARRSREPARNEALVAFLLDTGARAAEACALTVGDVDERARRCTVLGKGNKYRTLPIGRTAGRLLFQYLRPREAAADEPLFVSALGSGDGQALTVSGLGQLFRRLGRAARLQGVRCSPHTCRHSFAISCIRAGMSMFALQAILGHESLDMVRRYVAIAQADVEVQHARYSPMDRMKRKGGAGR